MIAILNIDGCDCAKYFNIIIGINEDSAPASPHRTEKNTSYPRK